MRHREIYCSFFTGCCFAVRTSDFLARNGFDERFFFGEEDFELALWMKKRGLLAVCLMKTVVQHKVGATINVVSNTRSQSKAFIHYLNRFIHMRLRLGILRWWLWVIVYTPYVILLLWHKNIINATSMTHFILRLLVRARMMNEVTRSDFEEVMAGKM
jgi:GT2 family glycosyltransferase